MWARRRPKEGRLPVIVFGVYLSHGLDLSVIIPAFQEGQSLSALLPELQQVLRTLDISYELLVVTADRDAQTTAAVEQAGARLIAPKTDGYGAALICLLYTSPSPRD